MWCNQLHRTIHNVATTPAMCARSQSRLLSVRHPSTCTLYDEPCGEQVGPWPDGEFSAWSRGGRKQSVELDKSSHLVARRIAPATFCRHRRVKINRQQAPAHHDIISAAPQYRCRHRHDSRNKASGAAPIPGRSAWFPATQSTELICRDRLEHSNRRAILPAIILDISTYPVFGTMSPNRPLPKRRNPLLAPENTPERTCNVLAPIKCSCPANAALQMSN